MNNVQPLNHCAKGHACCAHHLGPPFHIFELDTPNVFEGPKWKCNNLCIFRILYGWLLGCLYGPVKFGFRSLVSKAVMQGRENTRVWYQETTFSQMVSYDFLLHGPLHGYFLYLVSAPPEKPTRRCEPEEGYLRCSKRFDHGSHSIIFLLFEFKSVRWCWRWETQRNAHVAYKPTRRSR